MASFQLSACVDVCIHCHRTSSELVPPLDGEPQQWVMLSSHSLWRLSWWRHNWCYLASSVLMLLGVIGAAVARCWGFWCCGRVGKELSSVYRLQPVDVASAFAPLPPSWPHFLFILSSTLMSGATKHARERVCVCVCAHLQLSVELLHGITGRSADRSTAKCIFPSHFV